MDLSRGSIDLSSSGANAQTISSGEQSAVMSSVTSSGYFPNGNLMTHKPYYPSPEIPINREEDGQPDGRDSDCLDLSKTGPYSSNGVNYLHFSGGKTFDLSKHQNGITDNNFDLSRNGGYFQLPGITLDPNLRIDPTITYKPEMDYNHNHSDRIPSSTTSSPYEQSLEDQGSHIVTGNDVPGSRVTVEEVNSSRIPLTVTSADDDEIDSGTESIDSKDSEGSLRLSVEDENGPRSKEKTDRKRPGRKKGQVSKVYHLWEFIRDVLNDPQYCGKVIKWENEEEGIFRVVQSEVAATMWGAKKKNRTKMTYEKMSRSIRYSRKEGYFDDIPKDKGYPKKLCFKFGKKAHGWNLKRQISVEGR